ncbi:MAG: HNH endonuclease [Phycisphaerales bacterium]|nr:HNH endonuclease [Phycisphaerales bacterium]
MPDQTVLIQRGRGRRAQSLTVRIPSDEKLIAAALELKSHASVGHGKHGVYGTNCVVNYTPPGMYTKTEVNPFTGEHGQSSEHPIDERCSVYHWDGELTFLGFVCFTTDPPTVRLQCKRASTEQLKLFSAASPEVRIEGRSLVVELTRYERDPLLRAMCIAECGAACVICGFDFLTAYGDIADGFIHVHHLEPLSAVGEVHEVDPATDLVPVCPNCHAVFHMRTPPFSPDEVRAMIQQRG